MNYPGARYDRIGAGLLCPQDYRNPLPAARYHLVVIGAGPAGLIAAMGAAGLGARVALIEKASMGGDCLNVGCVPSKALLEYTRHWPEPDFAGAFSWLRQVRAAIAPHDSVERYTQAGVDVFFGSAEFTGQGQVRVGEQLLNPRRVAVCTGATADLPPIPGLAESHPLTNETVFDLQSPPGSLAVLGAGPIGCELALAFALLGVDVHLFEQAQRVLPLEEEGASNAVARALVEAGVNIHTGQAVDRVERQAHGCLIEAGQLIHVSDVLVALGRRPNTAELGLDKVGVAVSGSGHILTDKKLRTTNRMIYAAGDCTARLHFTHHADAQARALVQNTLFAATARVDGLVVPHCIYTRPEVASVGASRASLESAGTPYDEYKIDFGDLDRGIAEIDGDGFAVVYTKQGSDQILGATLVGHDAGEQIAPIVMLMSNRLGLRTAGKALFCYPTRSEYLKRLADAYTRSRLTPVVAKLLQTWLRLTG